LKLELMSKLLISPPSKDHRGLEALESAARECFAQLLAPTDVWDLTSWLAVHPAKGKTNVAFPFDQIEDVSEFLSADQTNRWTRDNSILLGVSGATNQESIDKAGDAFEAFDAAMFRTTSVVVLPLIKPSEDYVIYTEMLPSDQAAREFSDPGGRTLVMSHFTYSPSPK
jgi:hypothetical protein